MTSNVNPEAAGSEATVNDKTKVKWEEVSLLVQGGFAQLKQEDVCTDFTIEVGGKLFRCHKALLAAVSDYFKAMFSSGMKEVEHGKATIQDVDLDTFETMLSILYHDKSKAVLKDKTDEQMFELLNLSLRWQMQFLKKVCLDYFKETMTVGNCIQRWSFGRNLLCEEAAEMAVNFTVVNFENVVSEQMAFLLTLDIEDVLIILQDDYLCVKKEDDVWYFIKRWIDFDRESRKCNFVALLQQCCLTQIDPALLTTELAFDPLVRLNDIAADMIQEAVKFNSDKSIHGNIEAKLRTCYSKDQSLVLFVKLQADGTTNDSRQFVQAWSDREKYWSTWPPLNTYVQSCCVYGTDLYVTCGNKSTFIYEGTSRKWKRLSDLPNALTNHTMVAVGKYLYVLGGRNKLQPNADVLLYNVFTSEPWETKGEITQPVINASSVALKNKIYLFGGEIEMIPGECIQVYDTETNVVANIFTLPLPCRWSRALCRQKMAYLVTNDGNVIKVSLEYELCEILTSIPNFYCNNFGIDIHDGKLYVYGGKNILDFDSQTAAAGFTGETDIDLENCLISDRVVSVDLNTGEVQEVGMLPQPWEVLACARLIHDTVKPVLATTFPQRLTPTAFSDRCYPTPLP